MEKILTQRQKKAEQLFNNGYNCAQAVIGAVCEDVGLDFDTAMKAAEGFGGGMGRMRLVCGAVSGMTMAAGMVLSRGEKDGDTRAEVYSRVHTMADNFKEMNGSIICAELLGLNDNNVYNPKPEARTEKYYKKRPCGCLVTDCVGILEKELLN